MLKKIVVSIMAVVFLTGWALSQEEKNEQAANRLKAASSLKRTSFKQAPEAKEEILLKTVECYRSVCSDFPEDRVACAEACFRMGEIFRTLKNTEEAERAFKRTLSYEKSGEFAARSLQEIGHIYRRVKEYDQALSHYRRVLEECSSQKDVCADAFTWIGKVYLKQGEQEKARDILIGFADRFPEFPDEAIRNIDLAAGSLLDSGEVEKAEELLAKWRQHFEAQLGKEESIDRKIEKALEGMKTPERLKG